MTDGNKCCGEKKGSQVKRQGEGLTPESFLSKRFLSRDINTVAMQRKNIPEGRAVEILYYNLTNETEVKGDECGWKYLFVRENEFIHIQLSKF